MARGTKLVELRQMLMAEIGDNQNPNNLRKQEMNTLLSNKQKWLATEYDWPFLHHQWDVGCPANVQYVTLPGVDVRGVTAEIDWERPVKAEVFWNNIYSKIEYGVGPQEYNWQNFALGQGSDPIQRWQVVSNTRDLDNPNQIEVWPVPVALQVVRFQGQRMMQQMVADDDRADLDDMMLVMFVAADMLFRKKQADAPEKLQLAKQRLGRITSGYQKEDQTLILGEPTDLNKRRNLLPVIAIGGGGGGGTTEEVMQVYEYTGTDPNTSGIFLPGTDTVISEPENPALPAIAYKKGSPGPMFTWNTDTHVWF